MSVITNQLVREGKLSLQEEITPNGQQFSMFNTGGVEVEVGEFLYSLVRLLKPKLIIETGTHLGISSSYMALAIRDNIRQLSSGQNITTSCFGQIYTYEVIASLQQEAIHLWDNLELNPFIQSILESSLTTKIPNHVDIDFLFLDSEPQYRFDEFLRFWPYLKPGGLIAIHDIHATLGKSGLTHAGMDDWPFGPWEDKLGEYVLSHQVQMMHFPTPRGFLLMQKTQVSDENIKLLTKDK